MAADVLRTSVDAAYDAGDAYGAAGLRLHAASLCAPHARDAAELAGRYARLLKRLDALALELEAAPPAGNDARPARPFVGTLPIGWPYLGYAHYPLATRLARVYAAAGAAPYGVAPHCARPCRETPRVAVVAEFGGNTSPGLLFHNVFLGLAERRDLEVGLVVPEGLATPFTEAARRAAAFVVEIPSDDAVEAASRVERAAPDVVAYLALGLSVATFSLARRRLARSVVVFGHGHPLTSGLGESVDYFASSRLYRPAGA